MGNDEAAAAQYRRVLKTSDDLVAMNNLAWIYIEQGDRRGLDLATKAHELNPDHPGVADTYAWALIQAALAGDLAAAQRYLDELREAGAEDLAKRLEAVLASR